MDPMLLNYFTAKSQQIITGQNQEIIIVSILWIFAFLF